MKILDSKGKGWITLYFIQLHILLIFTIFQIEVIRNYTTVVGAVFEMGSVVNIVTILFMIWVALLAYSIYLIIKSIRKIRKEREVRPSRPNKIFPIVICIFFGFLDFAPYYVGNVMITAMVPMIQLAGTIMLIEIIVCGIFLINPLIIYLNQIHFQGKVKNAKYLNGKKQEWGTKKNIVVPTIIVAFFVFIMIIPFISISTNVISGKLSPKPMVFAHRGAGYIGPEDTIEGMQAMLPFGVVGTDLDLRISNDGVPFLCHDNTFYRTTNVAQVFSGRENDPVDSFNISQIEQLDAGSWFLKTPDALIAAKFVNESVLNSYRGAKVATLAATITFCEKHNWSVDCDFKGVSNDNPYASQYINITLGMILNSTIQHIYITNANINCSDPRIIYYSHDFNSTPAKLTSEGYSLIQIEDLTQPPSVFHKFTEAGFPVYYQFADDLPAFSAAWCLGCKFVISDTPFLFTQMTTPIWYVSYPIWNTFWIVIEAIFIGLAIRKIYVLNRNVMISDDQKIGAKI